MKQNNKFGSAICEKRGGKFQVVKTCDQEKTRKRESDRVSPRLEGMKAPAVFNAIALKKKKTGRMQIR